MEVGQFVSLQFEKLSGIVIAISAVRFIFFQRDWDPRKVKRKRQKTVFFKECSIRVTNYRAIYLRESLNYAEFHPLINAQHGQRKPSRLFLLMRSEQTQVEFCG